MVNPHATEQVESAAPAPRARLTPLSPQRFALQFTVGQEGHDLLHYAQALLGHALPAGDIAEVFVRALKALVRKLEQRKFAATGRTRPRRSAASGRYVPAEIRRTVWQRDGGQCTFVGENGHRCEARERLEFDHVDLVARGGQTSVDRLRLRCRAHNQNTAECTFGREFMGGKRGKREQARDAEARNQDVIPWLRSLGFRGEEARKGARLCAAIPNASLEERVRYALSRLAPNRRREPGRLAGSPA